MNPDYATHVQPILVPTNGHAVIGDWVTTNGGHVLSSFTDFGYGIGSDAAKKFGILHLSDLWDVLPFSRKKAPVSDLINSKIANAANAVYTKLFDPLYRSRFGYNYLGGQELNRIRYGSLEKNISKALKPIDKRVKNFEIGPLVKGKPFLLETDIPITIERVLGNNRHNDAPGNFYNRARKYRNIKYTIGFDADNILPEAYFDYMRRNKIK